jgi:mannose-6-phosphate isomerase-like protein (cupin superfamily)
MPDPLVFRDGRRVTFVAEGSDEEGPFLRIEHRLPRPARQAGPHWHPLLIERWTVRRGRLRFRIDGRELVLGPGESTSAGARQVHEFSTLTADVVLDHEVRPPLQHRRMFELWHALDTAGATTRSGLPRNPLALALLWQAQDGYLAGVPAWLQHAIFGGLARLSRALRYEQRLDEREGGVE